MGRLSLKDASRSASADPTGEIKDLAAFLTTPAPLLTSPAPLLNNLRTYDASDSSGVTSKGPYLGVEVGGVRVLGLICFGGGFSTGEEVGETSERLSLRALL